MTAPIITLEIEKNGILDQLREAKKLEEKRRICKLLFEYNKAIKILNEVG